jgi:ribosome modulation factor
MTNKPKTEDAHKYPHRFHQWNRAHRGAYKKGVAAFAAGSALDSCPYGDFRKGDGRLTWSRAFQAAWRDGWRDARLQNQTNN